MKRLEMETKWRISSTRCVIVTLNSKEPNILKISIPETFENLKMSNSNVE